MLVIGRAGQGGQHKRLKDIERQFALDDVDITEDRFLRVAGEPDDVAGAGDGAVFAPFLQHQPVFSDLVLVLLAGEQIVRVDVFKTDKDAANAGRHRLFDKVRDAVTQRVDLDRKADLQAL